MIIALTVLLAVPATTPSTPSSAPSASAAGVADTTGETGAEDVFDIFAEERKVIIASRQEESSALAASMVSVISRARIEREGARTLEEVLRGVVGFASAQGEYNHPVVSLRGYDTSANFLVMVDGIRLNDPYDGSVPWDYPLGNVKRIEIIRGPGSAVYGTNASIGVINIITMDNKDAVAVDASLWSDGSDIGPLKQWQGRAAVNGGWTLGKLHLNAQASFLSDAGDRLIIPSDKLSLNHQIYSEARCVDSKGAPVLDGFGVPILRVKACRDAHGIWNGHSENWVKRGEGALRLSYAGLELDARIIGDVRGPGLTSPQRQDLILAYQSQQQQLAVFAQAAYTLHFGEAHALRFHALYDQRKSDEIIGDEPVGYSQNGVVFERGESTAQGRIGRDFLAEAISNHAFVLSSGFLGHFDLEAGLAFDRRQVDASYYRQNFSQDGRPLAGFVDARAQLPPLFAASTNNVLVQCTGGRICTDGQSQTLASLFAQGAWQPNFGVSGLRSQLTAGLRADDDLATGFVASPRAGLTFVADDDALPIASQVAKGFIPDNLKLLFGSAFRVPTIQERFDNLSEVYYGNPQLKPETIASFEAGVGYDFLHSLNIFANYYYSVVDHSIEQVYDAGLEPIRQRSSRRVQGVELEMHAAYRRLSDAYFNFSLFDATDAGQDPRTGVAVVSKLEEQAHLLMSFGAEVQLYRFIYLVGFGNFQSGRASAQRSASEVSHAFVIQPYVLLNAGLRLKEPVRGLTIQLFARNLLDVHARDALPPNHEVDVKSAAGDTMSYLLPRAGLTCGLELIYQFSGKGP